MDILIIIMGIVFLSLLGAAAFFFLKEPKSTGEENTAIKKQEADLTSGLKKKILSCEEKIKNLEYSFEAAQLELNQTKDREKGLIKEKSSNSFDAQQYEKFKKEHQALKEELLIKEEALEKEISQRRQQASEFTQLKAEYDTIKKRVIESEDAFRKSQTALEALTKELASAKKTINDQKKVVQEHAENKNAGEWVSRIEFNKLQNELREKEALIKKLASPKPGEDPAQKDRSI